MQICENSLKDKICTFFLKAANKAVVVSMKSVDNSKKMQKLYTIALDYPKLRLKIQQLIPGVRRQMSNYALLSRHPLRILSAPLYSVVL